MRLVTPARSYSLLSPLASTTLTAAANPERPGAIREPSPSPSRQTASPSRTQSAKDRRTAGWFLVRDRGDFGTQRLPVLHAGQPLRCASLRRCSGQTLSRCSPSPFSKRDAEGCPLSILAPGLRPPILPVSFAAQFAVMHWVPGVCLRWPSEGARPSLRVRPCDPCASSP